MTTKESSTKKQDINALVNDCIQTDKKLVEFHSSLLVALNILSAEQVEKAIVSNNFDSSLVNEEKQEIESQVSEITTLIETEINPIVKTALENQLASLYQQLQDLEHSQDTLPTTASNFQESIDNFFQSGLNGLKKKSQLVRTEAEASASGTNCINYLFRNALLEKQTNVSVNQLLENTCQIIGKYYRSQGHLNNIINNLKKSDILQQIYLKNKTIFITY